MRHEYAPYFHNEIDSRKLFFLPPDTHMILIHFSSEDEALVAETAANFAKALSRVLVGDEFQMGEAVPSPMEKVAGRFRYQISIRTTKVMKASLILRQAVVGRKMDKRVKFYVDVDPYSLM
jgi:primosomal protein N' (replication factor Y)